MGKNKTQLLEEAKQILETLPNKSKESFEMLESFSKRELIDWIQTPRDLIENTSETTTNETEESTASTSDEEIEEEIETNVLESPEPRKRSVQKNKDVYKCSVCDFRSRNKKAKCSRHPESNLLKLKSK